jgi:hypothetical protein
MLVILNNEKRWRCSGFWEAFRLVAGYGEESPKDLREQNAGNVLSGLAANKTRSNVR